MLALDCSPQVELTHQRWVQPQNKAAATAAVAPFNHSMMANRPDRDYTAASCVALCRL
jgi:hypothetical protein